MTSADETKLDPAIVAQLYVEHGEELKRFLIGLLRDTQLAHDVLQATFMKLVEQGHTTQEQSRKSWLFRVAYHEAMAYRRRQNVGDKVVQKLAWSRGESSKTPDEPLIRLETIQGVQEAIEALSQKEKQIVRMRVYQEKTFAVIAEELGIPLGTALGRMRTALMKLKSFLTNLDASNR